MSGLFSFNQAADETDEETIFRACETIISTGVGIRGGKICPGGNNVWANNAANVFSRNKLEKLATSKDINEHAKNGAVVMLLRQVYTSLPDEKREEYGQHYLENIVHIVTDMHMAGWKHNAKPTNFDLNAAGAKLHGYQSPVGLVADFAMAFGIDYKKPKTTSKLEKHYDI